jgi:hypothetical protein
MPMWDVLPSERYFPAYYAGLAAELTNDADAAALLDRGHGALPRESDDCQGPMKQTSSFRESGKQTRPHSFYAAGSGGGNARARPVRRRRAHAGARLAGACPLPRRSSGTSANASAVNAAETMISGVRLLLKAC